MHEGPWQDAEEMEFVSPSVNTIVVRDQVITLPSVDNYVRHGIDLEPDKD